MPSKMVMMGSGSSRNQYYQQQQEPEPQSSISDSESTNMASTSAGKTKPKKKKYKSKQPLPTPPTIPPQNAPIETPDALRQNIEQVAGATRAAYKFLSDNDLQLHPSQALALEAQISAAARSLSEIHLSLSNNSSSLSNPPPSETKRPCWFHRFLEDAADEYDSRWTEWFRMSKTSFTLLLRLLTPSLSGLAPVQPNYALGAALFRLAHSAHYKAVGNRFGMDSATACLAFHTVCKGVVDKLAHLFELKTDINRIVVGFGWISLPNCCGVLGFDRFKVEGNLFGNDGFVMVQALVDSEGRFLDVSAGWPSNVKPVSILRQSEFYSRVEDSKELLDGPAFELKDGNSVRQYVLGESCLPVLPWLITPFDETDDMDASRRAFNSVHKDAMKMVATAFGKVRDQWQLLTKEWKEGCVEALPFVIVACCLLHNFLIKCSEVSPENNVEYTRDFELPVFDGEVDESGNRIRNALAVHLSRVSPSS
ncbi:protein ANTAGONIST OF LIKE HETEROCHROMATIN PROTEIN 1 isoform X2 [Daucus carota subsp. sativus]|uniref:protein ANTAGONIST OF LIKE HETEROCHROMATIN PROTEIN 1 isoform X2 n=1 Tax=Daucus carota subsp. sativus TaxID=79200 RepID=UPI0007EF4DD4|nr:PREDICTED: uncharacterized protein LOC108215738 [Daucus carota subsp. sativus]